MCYLSTIVQVMTRVDDCFAFLNEIGNELGYEYDGWENSLTRKVLDAVICLKN